MLPLCTVVNGKFCVMNGGLRENKEELADVVSSASYWASFSTTPGIQQLSDWPFSTFGPDVVDEFLNRNGFGALVMSNQRNVNGYHVDCDGKVVIVSSGRGGPRPVKSGIAIITGKELEMKAYDMNTVVPITVHAEGDSPGLNGIFAKLRKDFDVFSPEVLSIVKVVPYPAVMDIVPVGSVVTNTYDVAYMSFPIPGQASIIFCFPCPLLVEAYTIESAALCKNNDHMKTWKLMGSNDGESWEVIDEQKDVDELNGPLATKTFRVKNGGRFQILKLWQHEKNHRGNWNICLQHIDFFGTLDN